MASLVVEDGTGKATANTYISQADADTYFEKHLYGTSFSGASSANKDIALMMSTRLIDNYFSFEGRKVGDSQALEFPRFDIEDRSGFLIDSGTIPQALKDATAELAKWLIASDRTADASGKGFKNLQVGSLSMTPDTADKTPVLPDVVVKLLAPLGRQIGGGFADVKR